MDLDLIRPAKRRTTKRLIEYDTNKTFVTSLFNPLSAKASSEKSVFRLPKF